jgi:short-subunit dehydrogenase
MERMYAGKVIIVTGGTSGIGRELVRQLSVMGAHLYICGRNPQPGKDLERELVTAGGYVQFFAVDVSNAAAVEAFVGAVIADAGHIDYLFHCAGTIVGGEFRDHQLKDIQKVMQTNVFGTAYVSLYVYRIMAGQGFGHIINFSSAAGIFPLPLLGVYGATKSFVLVLDEALRIEGKGLGVHVSTVAPGIVDTSIYDTGIYSKADKERTKSIFTKPLWTIRPDQAAQRILAGTARNRTVIFTQWYGHFSWLSYRYVPHIYRWVVGRSMGLYRKRLRRN